jgi:hypothetical protein
MRSAKSDTLVFLIFAVSLCKSAVQEDINIEQFFDGAMESKDQSAVIEYLEYLASWIALPLRTDVIRYEQENDEHYQRNDEIL